MNKWMSRTTRPLLAVVLCLAALEMSQAAEPEPLEFKGSKMGSSEQELKELYPSSFFQPEINEELYRSLGERYKALYLSSHSSREVPRVFCESPEDTQGDRVCRISEATIAAVAASTYFTYYSNSLASILITFEQPEANFAPVLEALVEKYGPPTKIEPDEVVTGMGVKYTNQTATWFLPSGSITAQKYNGEISESIVYFLSTMGLEESKRRNAEHAKDAAKDL